MIEDAFDSSESIITEGWVEKKGNTLIAGYKKRWLVLTDKKKLKYYENMNRNKLNG